MMQDVRVTKLDNGIRIITSSMPRVESVAFGIWIGVGGRYEQNNMLGASHFIEHLLFKGTKKRSSSDISRAIEGRGGYLNAFTQEEHTCYYARVAYNHLWAAMDVLCDMYLNPRFAKSDIDKERGVIVEELMMYRDQPHHLVHEMLEDALWNKHPMGMPVIGTLDTLKGMNRKRIVDFKKKKYIPNNTVFSFAGKVDHDACVSKVKKYVDRLKKQALPRCKKVDSSVRQKNIVLQRKDIEQAHLAMGIRLFGRKSKDRYPLKLLSAVLGENMSSRLFNVVREKNGLAYSIHSSCHLFEDTGVLSISAGLDRARSDKAIELIIKELVRLKDKKIGASELKRGKDYIIGQLRLGLESTNNQMMWIGDNLISYGKFMAPEKSIEQISAITADEVQKLACSVLKKSRTSICMISPDITKREEKAISNSLASL